MVELPIAGVKLATMRALSFDSEVLGLGGDDRKLRLYYWRDAVKEAAEEPEYLQTNIPQSSYTNGQLVTSFNYNSIVSAVSHYNTTGYFFLILFLFYLLVS